MYKPVHTIRALSRGISLSNDIFCVQVHIFVNNYNLILLLLYSFYILRDRIKHF